MDRFQLISYAESFTSFLLRKEEIGKRIEKIILFGSVARNEFDEKSDVDIFIETGMDEKILLDELKIYNKSELREKYRLKGVVQEISLKVGRFKDWPSLKSSILENGIMLYGKYEEMPKKLEHFVMFRISVKRMKRKNQIKVWRKLYGYVQKIGRKEYVTKGMIEKNNGLKLAKGAFVVPKSRTVEIIFYLNKNRVDYKMNDVFMKKGDLIG